MSAKWRTVNLVCSLDGDKVHLEHKPLPKMRPELIQLFDRGELSKYLTEEEMADLDPGLLPKERASNGREAPIQGLAG